MKVIICGAGQVGLGIAERLAAEGNNVAIIDSSLELVQRANDMLDVRAIWGHGAHPDVLEKAGAREADMLIAVTLYDEVNMIACQVARTLFDVPTKIARVRAQTYLSEEYSGLFSNQSLPIDHVISPEVEVGNVILRRLETPGAFDSASFVDNKVITIGISCGPECPVIDTPLDQLAELFPDLPATVVAVIRNGELIVPHHDFQLKVGDDVHVVLPSDQVSRTLKIFGHDERQARRIIIAGGNIGLYVAREIARRQPNVRVKVIEKSRGRALEIADQLRRTVVLHGSSLSEDLLREAEVGASETLVAVTNDEQVNILTSVLAKQLGCQRAMCLVNSAGYSTMIRSFGIDAQVNPRATTASRILQFVRRGRIRSVHSVHNGDGELIEADTLETTGVMGKPLASLDLSDGIRFGAIVRGGKVVAPRGDTELMAKDRVVVFVRRDAVREVEQMFRVSPDYF